jgi:hypothetical protein
MHIEISALGRERQINQFDQQFPEPYRPFPTDTCMGRNWSEDVATYSHNATANKVVIVVNLFESYLDRV